LNVRSEIRPAVVILALLTLLTGGVYPLAVTVVSRLAFPRRSEGSLILTGGHAVGSRLIGQSFDQPRYFWGRLPGAGPIPYDASASSGSNLGPLNPALLAAARTRIAALRAADAEAVGPVPVDLVTASGSGLDPDVSPAAAEYQAARVARARGLALEHVRTLVRDHTTGRALGLFGEPRVNVLELNLALDALTAPPAGLASPPGGRPTHH
jgi:K+-transporting ATPase ATPase C chain